MLKSKKMFEQLKKMDPALAQALANVRSGVATKNDADLLARGMYTDSLIPKMGNKMAYNDFLSRNENSGVHVNADLNDFGQINKFHGDAVGDEAIKKFGSMASEVSRMFGGKSFRSGGDEFKFWFHKPEHAHGFARELRARLEREPKVAGTHNLAASIGIGYNRNHAESSLLEAKKQLGTTNVFGHRDNFHTTGNAPTIIHSKLHENMPEGWRPSKGMPEQAPKTTPNLAETGLKFHNPLGKNEVENPLPDKTHPVISGKGSVGIMTAENPMYPSSASGGNEGLENELEGKGLKFERVTGKYTPEHLENSYIIHNPTEEDMSDFGKRYGQESVIHSRNGAHKLIYTNGPNVGSYNIGTGHTVYETPPEMYYSTVMHNGNPLHFSLNFDFDKLLPMKQSERILRHPHGYDWHDGHTDHHQDIIKSDVLKHPHTDGAIPNQSKDEYFNQNAKAGVSTYHAFAKPYGDIKPGIKSDLMHYDYRPHEQKVNKMVSDNGYQVYLGGGKHGKPDLAKRNYNTGHLMIYDPTSASGGDFQDEAYTRTWRTVHELAHALTYPELNQIYGEGRRIGKLGVHRTPREAKRAVHWEWLAAHKQRELTEQLTGKPVPEDLFNKELNTVMHDAVHRAVTGQFTEPSDEGFHPHPHRVPLDVSLGMVDAAAQRLGIKDENSLISR